MSNNNLPVTPFEDIALMMSGGGYRAAAFHLGSMSYLNHIKFRNRSLLECVKVLSTISGGTFPGVLYAHAIHENRTFEDFYHALYGFMDEEDLLKMALTKLGNPSVWKNTTKSRNLTNAFSIVYHERLFGDSRKKNFGMLWDCDTHLEEVIFNATEFDRGLAFRFQKTLADKGIIGNYFLCIPVEQAKQIRLADIIAASSCFPAGLEPISFPKDFRQHPETRLDCYRHAPAFDEKDNCPANHTEPVSVGLMDGGIIDNQGIESIMVTEQRREKSTTTGKSLDLLIVSDVAGPFMTPFAFSDPQQLIFKSFRLKSIASSKNFLYKLTIATIFFIALFVAMVVQWDAPAWAEYLIFTIAMVNLVTALIAWLARLYFTRIIYSNIGQYFHQYLPLAFNLPVKVMEPMVKDRFNSVIQMVSEVFMKQIRRLVYDKIYENDKWENKRIANQIYALGKEKTEERKARYYDEVTKSHKTDSLYPNELIEVSEQVINVSDNASSMETTLWFKDEDRSAGKKRDDKLESLVTSGQFTMCFNLLRYMHSLRSDYEAYHRHPQFKDMESLFTLLQRDWEHFNHNPHWLFDEYRKSADNA